MTKMAPYELILILMRTDILDLIKSVALKARDTNIWENYYALLPILKQLTYIYRHNAYASPAERGPKKGKTNADSNKKMHL